MTQVQDNFSLAASARRRVHGDQLRHWAVDDAVEYIVNDEPDRALRRLVDSVFGEQARVAGIRVY